MSAAGCAQFHRVPPGQSLGQALAVRPQLIALPAPPPPALTNPAAADAQALAYAGPSVEPELPSFDMTDQPGSGIEIADPAVWMMKGDQMRAKGDTIGAIALYKEAVQIDPAFSPAWRNLALAYQDAGDEGKAMEAFRHFKSVAGN